MLIKIKRTSGKKIAWGFTLIELVIVIVIIGIVATLGVTHYGSYRESTLDREAEAILRLIVAAERVYRMEIGVYYGSSSIDDLNTNLKLLLSTASNRNWNYSTTVGGGSPACAQAQRNGGDSRNWRMRNNDPDPVNGAVCP